MPKYVTASIRVYPLVRKFLCKHFSIEPFVVGADDNLYGSFLWACLDRYPRKKEPKTFQKFTAELTVGTRHWMSAHGLGSYLSPEKVVAFNRFVKQSFLDQLVKETAIRESYGSYVSESVASFLNRYDLEESEMSLESAIRYYTRNRPAWLINSPLRKRAIGAGKIIPMPTYPDSCMVA